MPRLSKLIVNVSVINYFSTCGQFEIRNKQGCVVFSFKLNTDPS